MELESYRIKIDQINRQIITLLAERHNLVTEVAQLKKKKNLPIFDPSREEAMIATLKSYAKELNLDTEMIGALFNLILAYSKKDMIIE